MLSLLETQAAYRKYSETHQGIRTAIEAGHSFLDWLNGPYDPACVNCLGTGWRPWRPGTWFMCQDCPGTGSYDDDGGFPPCIRPENF